MRSWYSLLLLASLKRPTRWLDLISSSVSSGLTIQPERLSEIRNERRPNSKYAALDNCRMEVSEAETMMRRAGIRWLSDRKSVV